MAPNATALPMEFIEVPAYMSRSEACHSRRGNSYGRSSVSPSLMLSRSSPLPSFQNEFSVNFEELHRPSCRPFSRSYIQFSYPNSHAVPTKAHFNHPARKFNKFAPKRRTQSESVPSAQIEHLKKDLQVETASVQPKSFSSRNETTTLESKSDSGKLPSTAYTCAELEAAVSKTRPKLLTCAELEALQVQEEMANLRVPKAEEKKLPSPVVEKKELECNWLFEKMKSESPVLVLAAENKPEPIFAAGEMSSPSENASSEDEETESSTSDLSLMELNLSFRSPSISSDNGTSEEMLSRPSTPANSCLSPPSSESSGYESSTESFDSSSKFSDASDKMSHRLPEETDEGFCEEKTVKKSLLADFVASGTDIDLQPPSVSAILGCADEAKSIEETWFFPLLDAEFRAKFVTDVNQTHCVVGKGHPPKNSRKKSHRKQPPLDGDLDTFKLHPQRKNVTASNSTKKNRKTMSAALPLSPSTVMPVSTSPPGALQLPSPPRAWRSDATACKDHRGSFQSALDITQEIKQLVGVAPQPSSGHVVSGSPIIVH